MDRKRRSPGGRVRAEGQAEGADPVRTALAASGALAVGGGMLLYRRIQQVRTAGARHARVGQAHHL